MSAPDLVPNRPTELGRKMGAEIARLYEAAEAEQRKRFPNMKSPCSSCAFRRGTLPNGCEETVMDALKAVIQMDTFKCHMKFDADRQPTDICTGWFIAVASMKERGVAPWPYSHEGEVDPSEYADAEYAKGNE